MSVPNVKRIYDRMVLDNLGITIAGAGNVAVEALWVIVWNCMCSIYLQNRKYRVKERGINTIYINEC